MEVVEVGGGWGVVKATGSCVFVNRAVHIELNILLAARRGLLSVASVVAVGCEGGRRGLLWGSVGVEADVFLC